MCTNDTGPFAKDREEWRGQRRVRKVAPRVSHAGMLFDCEYTQLLSKTAWATHTKDELRISLQCSA